MVRIIANNKLILLKKCTTSQSCKNPNIITISLELAPLSNETLIKQDAEYEHLCIVFFYKIFHNHSF